VDVHLHRCGLQPGTHPESRHGKCWREGMRSSVSVRADQAQKGTPGTEIVTKSYPHSPVGPYPVAS
jgi:hypothetical protein